MEKVSLEQIDLIMQRANVSYSEAKEALEQCNGDTLEALVLLEKSEKIKSPKSNCSSNTGSAVKSFFGKLNATRFILCSKEKVYINIPLSIAILAIICCFYVSVIGLIIAFCYGIRIKIEGENEIAEKLNSGIDFIKH